MADLALGTPEVGAVNFNVMHTLMHAILSKLDIAHVKADISEEDKEFLTTKTDQEKEGRTDTEFSDKDSAITGMTDVTEKTDRPLTRDSQKKESIPYRRSPYHELDNKVVKLQEQIDRLNSLPTNDELFERSRGEGERPRPVSDMWQALQLKNRVDANEEGVSKVSVTLIY